MKKFIFPLVLLVFCCATSQAQGNVTEKVEPKVALLMQRFVDINKSTKTISGWRIQILATTDRQRIEDALRKFESQYPNIPADWVQSKPYYKLRAGAYTSKRNAIAAQYLLKNDYPTAYPVTDNEIKPEELIK
ncbi:MAG: SPOR domain-containing protein [Saprospiraceae bacterium]|nr:SPOR domain-containing protein [Saprospiraceae bacterium]MCF8252212.1 SPOR domain-containing protein [Saprospiraceae bacterium]MCF8282010.1 SPOR domain-containing protein [Bacteroidales bacterium]MCF8311668.1 SPOR domain-containing protein [Saprospiraceae bacterium]MCF8442587.1 SPOR domain-containing protein [Saprospiraceae bacterium]